MHWCTHSNALLHRVDRALKPLVAINRKEYTGASAQSVPASMASGALRQDAHLRQLHATTRSTSTVSGSFRLPVVVVTAVVVAVASIALVALAAEGAAAHASVAATSGVHTVPATADDGVSHGGIFHGGGGARAPRVLELDANIGGRQDTAAREGASRLLWLSHLSASQVTMIAVSGAFAVAG
jgi:hypothetical protein